MNYDFEKTSSFQKFSKLLITIHWFVNWHNQAILPSKRIGFFNRCQQQHICFLPAVGRAPRGEHGSFEELLESLNKVSTHTHCVLCDCRCNFYVLLVYRGSYFTSPPKKSIENHHCHWVSISPILIANLFIGKVNCGLKDNQKQIQL